MGGHISVGVRRKDGIFRTIGVWTNPLKYYVLDERFLTGSLDPIDEFFARYLKDDSEDSFGGPQETVPGEYGFVLIDAVDGIVMNWSHYTRLGNVRLDEIGIELGEDMKSLAFVMGDDSVELRNTALRFMIGATGYDRKSKMWGDAPFNGPLESEEKLAEYVMTFPVETVEHHGETLIRRLPEIRFTIGSPAWKFIELNHFKREDFAVARAHVERCVTLTDEEKAAWDGEFKALFGNREEE
jgi:hypothetical protein